MRREIRKKTTKAVHFSKWAAFFFSTIKRGGHIDAYQNTGQPSGNTDAFE